MSRLMLSDEFWSKELINNKHPLIKLAKMIDWSMFETCWS